MMNINTFSGHSNQGFQLASNFGQVNVNIQTGGPSTRPIPSSIVPFRRDDDFVDRDILAEVDKKCSKPASRVALVGLGGVGKSQLAIEYSYRVRDKSPQTWIFWVHASNATRFEEGYKMIADRIKLPQRDEPTADILQLVSNWLCDEANGRWIMILDNADDFAVFSDPRREKSKSDNIDSVGEAVSLSTFLPQTPNGSILVTSRSKDAASRLIGSNHNIIKVDPMDKGCALLLFEKKLGGEFDKDDATELLQALDYMPLAISQAAAYISHGAPWTTVSRYLDAFRKSEKNQENLLNRDAGDLRRDNKASNSIFTTWQISFEYIRNKRPSAARLLSLMSFFDRQGIPEFLLHRYDDTKGDGSDTDIEDTADVKLEDDGDMMFKDDIITLTSYSLITRKVKSDQFEMHRLVQFSTRKWLEQNNELEKWKMKYIRIISEAFPEEDYKNWTSCQVLFPHAEAVLAYRPAEKKNTLLVHWSKVLHNASAYAKMQGNYLIAEEMNRQALDGREEALGKEHPETLGSLNNLALVLQYQGKYEAAEEMHRRALEGGEKTLGKEHPNTLESLNNLATALRNQGKYEAAEEMHRQALEGREKALGKEHPNTLESLNNLATALQNQGKYEAAEEMHRQALEGREKALGKEHPSTLTSLNNLASLLHYQGKYEAAEEMHRRALEGSEKALGKEHPSTLTSLNNLASLLHYQGKYEAAEEMHRQALEGREKALGKEHPSTLTSLNNLASLLHYQGKYEAAEEMHRQALEGREKALGKEHPSTLTSLNNLALVLQNQGKYEAAEEMHRRALEGREKALGKEHPSTLTSLNNLALVLQNQGKYEAAEEMHRRALEGREKALGKEHPDTLGSLNNLALVLQYQRKYEAAEEMHRRALEGVERVLGDEHPNTLRSVYCLAFLRHRQKRYTDAKPLYERSCAGFQKVLGINHPTTQTCSKNYSSMIEEMNADPSRRHSRGINWAKPLKRARWWRKGSRS